MNDTQKKVFYNLRLFDGIKDKLQDKKFILVEGDKIAGIEDESAKGRYKEYEFINLNGLTLLPGLIDAHIHVTLPFIFVASLKGLLQMQRQLTLNFTNCVKYGVTTVRDVAAFPKKIKRWRAKIDTGEAIGPRILTTNSFITSKNGVPEMAPTLNPIESFIAGGQFVERVSTPEEVKKVANKLIDQGSDWLKTQYSEQSFLFHGKLTNLSDECFMALMKVSRDKGVKVAMHHTEAVGFSKGLQVGVDTLEHCSTDTLEQSQIDLFVKKGMAIVPTLKVLGDYSEIEEMRGWLNGNGKTDFMSEPLSQTTKGVELMLRKPYPPADYMKKYYPDIEFFRKGYPVTLKNIERIKNAGGKIGVGTDTCGTGLSFFGHYWKELKHLIDAGFSNSEALKAATSLNAEILGMEGYVGSIQPGKYADFAIIEGNPLEDIERVKDVKIVIKGGENITECIK
jgi:imidazolonepropionase-like amidohydrolase